MFRPDSGDLLALFPLQLVAFPGSAVPLHIFEERYREMVGEAEATGSEFGIVLARDGGIVNAGCTVIVETVLERYPDGRLDVITRGKRRFTIVSIDEDRPFLRGEVQFFEDTDWSAVNATLRERALAEYRKIREAQAYESVSDVDADDPQLSFQLASAVPDLDFQDMILRSRSEAERLQRFIEAVEPYLEKKKYRAKMQKVAGQNGSGHKPAGI
jgi:Lon protease-like protein